MSPVTAQAYHDDPDVQDGTDPLSYANKGPDAVSGAALVKTSNLSRSYLINLFWILTWYMFATCLSLYNKWMFSSDHYNFQFPLFVTSTHMVVQFTLSGLTLCLIPRWRPKRRPKLRDYLTKIVPCGLATGLDIGLSNLSLKTISLSFYTMCKSSTLIFVLLFAFFFRLERPTWSLALVIFIISMGVLLMVMDETEFVFAGFAEVMTASMLGGLRWSLTQILLEKESLGINNPVASIFFISPIMGTVLVFTSAIVEGYHNIFYSAFYHTVGEAFHTSAIILLGGCLAFFMVMSEFFLIQRTSVVTLSVCGIFKEVATIFVSSMIFGDILTPVNIFGLCVALCGIALFNWLKVKAHVAKVGDVGREGGVAIVEPDAGYRRRKSLHVYSLVAESTPMLLLNNGMTVDDMDETDEEDDDMFELGSNEHEDDDTSHLRIVSPA
ncbi:hypothetical protein BZG36_03651 [Bifiguratus adelaidae]|uniref:Sugar phosphate transporter domain-containing protein n=1 Tax=Bifiguratus adelaidae TaxID=1938954 RepID=A0A261XW38_9FUNG|nr:hypothetical protein BZG36_03651 [Bifiguratus adelaidae]